MKDDQLNESTPVGTKIAGGYFTGIIISAGFKFAIITAGKHCEIKCECGCYGEKIIGAGSFTDGLANTNAMAEAGSKLAQKVRAMREGGHDDWAIPARDQQEPQYRNIKPTTDENFCGYLDGYNANSFPIGEIYTEENPLQTTVDAFKEGGEQAFESEWHLSSTQHSANYAFGQDFEGGSSGCLARDRSGLVRPVRMVKL